MDNTASNLSREQGKGRKRGLRPLQVGVIKKWMFYLMQIWCITSSQWKYWVLGKGLELNQIQNQFHGWPSGGFILWVWLVWPDVDCAFKFGPGSQTGQLRAPCSTRVSRDSLGTQSERRQDGVVCLPIWRLHSDLCSSDVFMGPHWLLTLETIMIWFLL